MSDEHSERLVPHGPAGPRGEPGPRGEQGMTAGARRAVVYLFLLAVALAAGNLLWSSHLVSTGRHQQQVVLHQQQVQGQIVERKICATLGALAALKPPAGDPVKNPSRAFDQRLHATLAQLSPDIGCPR